jgi:hypothetical protein
MPPSAGWQELDLVHNVLQVCIMTYRRTQMVLAMPSACVSRCVAVPAVHAPHPTRVHARKVHVRVSAEGVHAYSCTLTRIIPVLPVLQK